MLEATWWTAGATIVLAMLAMPTVMMAVSMSGPPSTGDV
jgi:hypothetical protein